MAKLPASVVIEGSDLFIEFKGAFTENLVAQELAVRHNKSLYYWTSTGTAEVDFVLPYEMDIYPLEVKAGTSKKEKKLACIQ